MATAIDKVRLLIADVDTDNPVFVDEQIDTFLDINDGNIRLAAADALDAIATSEVLVSKVIRTQDLQTDGAKVAAELRARAAQLRQLARDEAEPDVFDITNFPSGRRVPELTEYPVVWGL